MATAQDVVNAVQAAMDAADDLAGIPRTGAQLAALQAQVSQLQNDLAAANAIIAKVKADVA